MMAISSFSDSDVTMPQGNIVEFQKTDTNDASVLAGHEHVKKTMLSDTCEKDLYRWWYILKCLLLSMVAVGNWVEVP